VAVGFGVYVIVGLEKWGRRFLAVGCASQAGRYPLPSEG